MLGCSSRYATASTRSTAPPAVTAAPTGKDPLHLRHPCHPLHPCRHSNASRQGFLDTSSSHCTHAPFIPPFLGSHFVGECSARRAAGDPPCPPAFGVWCGGWGMRTACRSACSVPGRPFPAAGLDADCPSAGGWPGAGVASDGRVRHDAQMGRAVYNNKKCYNPAGLAPRFHRCRGSTCILAIGVVKLRYSPDTEDCYGDE
jgi:hypothetical protein